MKRTSEVRSSTGVTAEMVRLSTIPQLFVTAMPSPPLIASTPLLTSSMLWSVVAFEGDGEVDVGHVAVEVVAGENRHDRRLVHELEMSEVDAVLQDILRVHFQGFAVEPLLRVVVVGTAGVVEAREHVGGVEERVAPLDVVPDVDGFVALHDRVGTDATAAVGPILVGNADVAAVVVPLPAMEGTLDDVALHVAAVTQMRAQVLAVGIHHCQLTGFRAPGDHLRVEVLHPAHIAGLDLV